MIYTMDKALVVARQKNVPIPKNIEIYMDDCWCTICYPQVPRRAGLRSSSNYTDPAEAFNTCLNSIHSRVKFTREAEEVNKIAFLDVLLTRSDDDGSITTQIFRKPSNTNIILKPNSCNDPRTFIASFKGELCWAHRLCTSLEQTQKEIKYILDVYEDNGHDRKELDCLRASPAPTYHLLAERVRKTGTTEAATTTTTIASASLPTSLKSSPSMIIRNQH
jgi:hypothetical protein